MKICSLGTPQEEWSQVLWQLLAPHVKPLPRFLLPLTLGLGFLPYRLRGYTTVILGSVASQTSLTWLARVCGLRVVWIAVPLAPTKKFILLRLAALAAHAILAANQTTEASYLRRAISSAKIVLAYPPSTIANTLPEHREPVTFGCDGSLLFDQGLATALAAFARASEIDNSICLLIGGAIRERDKIEWLSRNLNIRTRVQLAPSHTMLWTSSCPVYLLPTAEGVPVPRSLVHAMGNGAAVIATSTRANNEFLKPNQTAIIIEPQNAEMLAQAMLNLARHPHWIRQLGVNCQEFASERFSEREWNRRITDVFSG